MQTNFLAFSQNSTRRCRLQPHVQLTTRTMPALKGLCHELPSHPEKSPPPLKLVNCMVKWPCACCGLSFLMSIVLTSVGIQSLIASSGPLGPFKIGVDYPNSDLIARNSDALVEAVKQSEIALFGETTSSFGFGRRLSVGDDSDDEEDSSDNDEFIQLLEKFLGYDVAKLFLQARQEERAHERRLKALEQDQQTEVLATLLLVVGARDGVDNLFDKEGIDQLCRFRNGLMYDEPTFPDYCWLVAPNDTVKGECSHGVDALPMFFGDSAYDIEDIDLEDFQVANFDDIYTQAFIDEDFFGAYAAYGTADVNAVLGVVGRLFGYLGGAWSDNTFVCQKKYAKDPEKVLAVLAAMRNVSSLEIFDGVLNQYFDSNFTIDNPVSRYTKGRYFYGAPLKGYKSYGVDDQAATDEQAAKYQQWWAEKRFRDLYPEGPSDKWPTGQPTVLNTALLLSELLNLLLGDGLRAVAPVLVVTGIVWLQTGSLLIALVTIFEIIISLGIAVFVTTTFIGIKWLSFQVALALYIVLAIGADDVFVFMDAYKQSFYRGSMVNESLATRMAWVYRRAGLAMLITSFTTCAAFIASALTSEIPELVNFGIFAAFVIFADYIMVMTFLCANCIVFHNYFETKPGLCCACCEPCAPNHRCAAGGCSKACDFSASTLAVTSTKIAQDGKADEVAKSRLVTLFEDTFPFNTIVKPKPMRYASILVCVILLILAAVSASGIEPQTSTEDFLPDDHPFQRYSTWNNEFDASNLDQTVQMNFVWGFKDSDPLNQDGVNLILDADFKGVVNYREGFELSQSAQTALLDACNVLEEAPPTKVDIDSDTGNATVLVSCFIRTFKDYVEYQGESFPIEDAAVAVDHLLSWVKNDTLPEEVASSRWTGDIGWRLNDKEDVTLAYLKLRAASKINERGFLPAATTRELYEEWEEVLDDVNKLTEDTAIGPAFQVSGTRTGRGNKWIFMTVQEAYVRMALIGAGAGLAIATGVLFLATRNVLMTVACIGTILAALVCVVGTIVAMGWQLGSNESLSIMVLTGFAVDYVVHLSHAYMESKSLDRLDRVHDALRDLGISVFWGMLTSLCAASALASCQLQNLSKFGIFFALTISYAYLWSVLFLMPLLAIIGPQPNAKEYELNFKESGSISTTSPTVGVVSAPPSPPSSSRKSAGVMPDIMA
jgi:hypothetical protein